MNIKTGNYQHKANCNANTNMAGSPHKFPGKSGVDKLTSQNRSFNTVNVDISSNSNKKDQSRKLLKVK